MSPRDDGVDDERVRPASIGELAEYATRFEWDASRDLKHCLRMAESSRNRARAYQTAGDLESAFVFFARAATIALEKLPAHPQYSSALTSSQRDNLGLVRSFQRPCTLTDDIDVAEWSGNPRLHGQNKTCSC